MTSDGKARILVVEDEALIAMDLQALLEEAGYNVLGPANTSEAALALIANDEPDVALLDVNLGRSDAFGVANVLAERKTEATIARIFLDECIERHLRGELDASTASMAKWWLTQKQCEIVDDAIQVHGGYGYMTEYPIARMWADARVQRIYAGSNEIMKELIAWSL